MESGKIFVGGLDWNTDTEGLKKHFSSYGEVTDCIVMTTPVGKSRGFGFVTFADPDCVNVCLSQKHSIDGRSVDAKPCSARGSANGGGGGGGNKSQRPAFSGRTTKIFVGGLPNDATDPALREFFSKRFGQVTEVVIMEDKEKGKPRGFGFLTFDSEEAVEAAVKEHYVEFNGKKVECKRAEPRQGGGGGGRKQNFNDQGWGDSGWNQNQGYGGYGQQGNSFGGYGNQGYDQSWNQQQQGQYGGGQNWGANQGYNYGQGGYQQGYTQGYGANPGYGGAQGYSANQGYNANQGYGATGQGYNGGSQGYNNTTQGYGGAANQAAYGSQQSSNYGTGAGSQDGYSSGGKASSNSNSQQGYHPYKR